MAKKRILFFVVSVFVLATGASAQTPPTARPVPTPGITAAPTPPTVTTAPTPAPGVIVIPSPTPGVVTPIATPTPGITVAPTPIPLVVRPAADLPNEPPPVAPNFEAPIRPLPSAERVGVDLTNQLSLSLEEAIELALKNNNDIDASRNTVQIAEFNLRGARGVYDPLMDGESYFDSTSTPTASTIGGAVNGSVTQTRYFGSAGLSGFSPWLGGSYSARFDSARSSTTNTNATLNPQFPALFTMSYTQPLLRNRGFDNNRRLIEIAKKNLSLSDAQFRQRAIEVIAQVEQAYWNLAFALRFFSVQIDAVKQARTQLESNQRQVAKGVLAPIEIVAATGQIATFEQNVYTAQEGVTRAENVLKALMLPDRAAAEWSRPITPVSPISLEPPQVSLDNSIAEALQSRPEIAQFNASEEVNKIDERYFRNQTKPQIDLVGSYTSQGLAGSVAPNRMVPPNLIGGYFTSLGNLISQDYPSYRVGVTVSLPWGNTVAKANLGRTLAEGDRLANQRAQAEQTIESEVRNAIQALHSAESRVAAAIASRESAEKLYESEQRQFRAGTTTFYLVLQRQDELLQARSRELFAQTDLNKSISEFQRATGTTLAANNVTVSQDRGLKLTPEKRTTAFLKARPFSGQ
jgi:outer membrane protein TolC